MTDQILIECLRVQAEQQNLIARTAMQTAANRIEELVEDRKFILDERDRTFALMLARAEEAESKLALMIFERDEVMIFERDEAWKRAAHSEKMWGEAEVKLAKAAEALKSLHHAVCGETGFASAVRNHSGKAYPWESLDIADAQTRAMLGELEGM